MKKGQKIEKSGTRVLTFNINNKILLKSKRSQINMSFGMIFSIILVIVFLAFAFYAIRTFMNIGGSAQAGKFVSDLQNDIDRIWRGTESSEQNEYFIPSGVDSVCFVDFSVSATGSDAGIYSGLRRGYYGTENMIFYPVGSSDIESAEIRNINLGAIIETDNPYCITASGGRVRLTLKKDFGEDLVRISR